MGPLCIFKFSESLQDSDADSDHPGRDRGELLRRFKFRVLIMTPHWPGQAHCGPICGCRGLSESESLRVRLGVTVASESNLNLNLNLNSDRGWHLTASGLKFRA